MFIDARELLSDAQALTAPGTAENSPEMER